MPYTINNPPEQIKGLPSHAAAIWVSAFNGAYKEYGEDRARMIAWAAVKNKYKKESDKWVPKETHESFRRIYGNFKTFWGWEGEQLYADFIIKNNLDESKAYAQDRRAFEESFKWTEPLIKYWRQDEDAKYYKVRLLSANVSMNENDYSNPEHLEFAASNLAWRPLNLDHNHKLRLDFPDNRLEVGKKSEEGTSIEAVFRISNGAHAKDTGDSIQKLIESEAILHPSVEAHPICGLHEEGGVKVPTCGYYLDEVALLRKNVKLPGDPLSHIFPLPLNESLSSSLIESLSHNYGVNLNTVKPKLKESENKQMIEQETQEQKAKVYFKISDEDWGKLSPEQKAEYIAKLPKEEKEPEQEPQKENVEAVAMKDKQIADLTDAALKAAQKESFLSAKLQEALMKNAEKDEKIAELQRENANYVNLKALKSEIDDKFVKEQSSHGLTRGKLNEALKSKDYVADKLDKKEQETVKLQENIGKLSVQLENIRRELNDESTKRAEATQKALNETKERSRIQFENAVIREDNAKITRALSESSQKRVDDAKRIMTLEEEIAQIKIEVPELRENLEKAKRLTGMLKKTLESLGYKVKSVPS